MVVEYEPNTPTNHNIRSIFFSPLLPPHFFPFLIIIFGTQSGGKKGILARFLPFFEGTGFVPYPRFEKVSRRHILGPY